MSSIQSNQSRKSGQSYIVPIELVIPSNSHPTRTHKYFINKMVAVLQKQGQIEPLQVKDNLDGTYTPYEQDAWSDPMILAARQLNWPTMLIGITDVYED